MIISPRSRARARRHVACKVYGCDSAVAGLSHYCNRHKLNDLRYGSPTATRITKPELKPFAKVVNAFITANEQHPDLLETFSRLSALLAQAASVADRQALSGTRLRPRDWASRRVRELKRLHDAGVTGGDVYRAAGAVWLLHHEQPNRLPAGKPLRFALARAVLGLVDRYQHPGPKRPITNRFATLVLDNLGQEIISELSGCLGRMVVAVERAKPSQSPEPTEANV